MAVPGEGMGQRAVGVQEGTERQRASEKGLRHGVGGQQLAVAAYPNTPQSASMACHQGLREGYAGVKITLLRFKIDGILNHSPLV